MKVFPTILISLFLTLLPLSAYSESIITQAQFTTQVSDREPVDDLETLPSDFTETVYYYTDLRDCVGCTIEHQWIRDGEVVYSRKSVAKYPRWRWWSGKSNLEPGTWSVNIVVNGDHAMVDQLEVELSTPVLMQQAPVQYRVQKRVLTECDQELEYWENQLAENPTEEYYKFKLYTWQKRCSVIE